MASVNKKDPPVRSFQSSRGRTFTVEDGEARRADCTAYPILYRGEPAGQLFDSDAYGANKRWHASTRAIYWKYAADAPVGAGRGIGYDVAAFETAEACLAAWSNSADQILDYAAAKVK